MQCPLCKSNKNIAIRRTDFSELRNSWIHSFGFDPFGKKEINKYIEKKRCAVCSLEFFDPPIYGDGDFYERISKNRYYYETNKWEYDIALNAVLDYAPSDLLEIGCGNGHFLEKILHLGLNAEGVDINRDAVDICKKKGLQVDVADVFEIDKSYDMIVLFEVLEHMDNAYELFNFITTKLLKKGGHLVIAVPNPEGYLKYIDNNLLDMPPHHNSSWSLSCFQKLKHSHNLNLIKYEKEPIRLIHYQCYLDGLISSVSKISNNSWKFRIFYKLQSILIRLLSPMAYSRDATIIDGQTHLVVFLNE